MGRVALPHVWKAPAMNTQPLEEIATKIIDLTKTDMLVLTMPSTLDDSAIARLRLELTNLVPDEHRKRVAVVVLSHGMGLNAISDDQLARIGYKRVSNG